MNQPRSISSPLLRRLGARWLPGAAGPGKPRPIPFAPLPLCPSAPSLRRAFTLIELIIVIILVGVLAGLIAPRMINSGRRQADYESAQITHLLGLAARRATLSGEIVAIEYDGSIPRLSMTVLREVDSSRGRRQTWAADPLAPSVDMEQVDILRAAADGQVIGTAGSKWWIDFNPSEPRPALWLLVGQPGGELASQWQVELLPEETTAGRRPAQLPSRASLSGALRIDLDASNQGERAW